MEFQVIIDVNCGEYEERIANCEREENAAITLWNYLCQHTDQKEWKVRVLRGDKGIAMYVE